MNQPGQLAGKVAVLTGAAGEIGAAAARLMAERGATIVAVDRDAAGLERLTAAIGGDRVLAITSDVTDEAQVRNYVETARRVAGRIDIFFNNAGIEGGIYPIPDYPLDLFQQVLAVNVTGVFLGMKHVIPVMVAQGGGVIVNTASVAGLVGAAGLSAYVASKHAVVGLTRSAAAEWASRGVRINSVNPGPVEGRMMAAITEGTQPGHGEEAAAQLAAALPSGRYSTPEEVAAVVGFLASDEARNMHGACYTIDGGQTAV